MIGDHMTPSQIEKRIYRLSGVCVLLAAMSFVVPRFVPTTEGGFASGAMAVLILLITLGIAVLFSLYLLSVTVRQYRRLSILARVAGLVPCLLFSMILFGLIVFVRY